MNAIIPLLIAATILYGLWKRVDVLDAFVEGAGNALHITKQLLPLLMAMMIAIGILRSTGFFMLLARYMTPLAARIGIPIGTLPLLLMRPISGAAATAMLSDVLQEYGPDSYTGRVASVMMGSSETIIYTLTVYLGTVGIKSGRHALFVAICTHIVAFIAAIILCSWI